MQGQIAAIEAEADEAHGEQLEERYKMIRMTRRQLRTIIREACGLATPEEMPAQHADRTSHVPPSHAAA